jgi:hypothetical protein
MDLLSDSDDDDEIYLPSNPPLLASSSSSPTAKAESAQLTNVNKAKAKADQPPNVDGAKAEAKAAGQPSNVNEPATELFPGTSSVSLSAIKARLTQAQATERLRNAATATLLELAIFSKEGILRPICEKW